MIGEAITIGAGALVAYHHAAYPAMMAALGKKALRSDFAIEDDALPTVTVVMAAYNEARHIAQKIANIAAADYPHEKLRLVIGTDGCTDDTANIARQASAQYPRLKFGIWEYGINRGKVTVLNELMTRVDSDICVLTDVSAEISQTAIRGLAQWFVDPAIGAVGGGYSLNGDLNTDGASYWSMQTAVKVGESRAGGLIGAHGALYAIRTACWAPLPADTINDDFIIPMRIAADGWKTAYDPSCMATERDATGEVIESKRRARIGAGNMQQLLRLIGHMSLLRPGLAFAFLSGKVLRVMVPVLMLICLVGSLMLAGENRFFTLIGGAQVLAYLTAAFGYALRNKRMPKPMSLLTYLVAGHAVSGIGAIGYLTGRWGNGWKQSTRSGRRSSGARTEPDSTYLPMSVRVAKRTTDIVGSLVALTLTLPLFPAIALMIKLDSRGPVFFRQRRVGRAWADRTEIFMMIKFRSMSQDAEKHSGAVWATKQDPRITRTGRFLRKTRLDELPQLLNVLKGEMSLIGPRPERPELCGKLEGHIPLYMERTYGLRPGITGLAQVNQGYDETIEDVRNKVLFDHAYAACSCRLIDWATMDLSIAAKTIGVMGFGRGQ